MLAAKAMSSELKRFYKSLFQLGTRFDSMTRGFGLAACSRVLNVLAPEDFAVFHHELHIL